MVDIRLEMGVAVATKTSSKQSTDYNFFATHYTTNFRKNKYDQRNQACYHGK